MLRLTLAALAMLAVLAAPALAFTGRSGDRTLVQPGETINDDLYMAGREVLVLGRVNGDLVAAGAQVDVTGAVTGSVIAAGGQLDLQGPVGGTARLAGGNIDVEGAIARDLVAAGGTIRSIARVGRDVVVTGGSVTLAGTIAGRVTGGMGRLVLSGTIEGPVEVEADHLAIESTAVIRGPLVYRSNREATIAQGAQVGEIRREAPRLQRTGRPFLAPWGGRTGILWRVFGFVWLLLLGLLLVWVAPNLLDRGAAAVGARPGSALLAGLVWLIVVPALAVVALITVVGIPIGVIALLLYGVAIYVSHVFAGMAVGRLLLRAPQVSAYGAMAIGLLLLALATAVPVLGPWIRLLAIVFGLGAMYLSAREAYAVRRAEGTI